MLPLNDIVYDQGSATPMSEAETNDPVLNERHREFCDLCRAGKLFAVQAWFKEGRPIASPPYDRRKDDPMAIAIERGFHSLVEVLLQNGFPPDGDALYDAISPLNRDLVDLLFAHGADVRSVDFGNVVETNNKELIQLFIDRGADVETGYPLVDGFMRAPRLFCGVYKNNIEKFPSLKTQAEIALRQFCEKGRMQGICLMLWLGADPRSKIPYDEEDDDPEFWDSALSIAIRMGDLEAVKKMKPNAEQDDLNQLLRIACRSRDLDLIRYFIKRGADPSWIGPDGECALRSAFWNLGWAADRSLFFARSETEIRKAKDCLFELVRRGARWNPNDKHDFSTARKVFYALDWPQTVEVLNVLQEHSVFPEDVLVKIFNTPKMRRETAPHVKELASMIPWFARWLPKPPKTKRAGPGSNRKRGANSRDGIPINKTPKPKQHPQLRDNPYLVQPLDP